MRARVRRSAILAVVLALIAVLGLSGAFLAGPETDRFHYPLKLDPWPTDIEP